MEDTDSVFGLPPRDLPQGSALQALRGLNVCSDCRKAGSDL